MAAKCYECGAQAPDHLSQCVTGELTALRVKDKAAQPMIEHVLKFTRSGWLEWLENKLCAEAHLIHAISADAIILRDLRKLVSAYEAAISCENSVE